MNAKNVRKTTEVKKQLLLCCFLIGELFSILWLPNLAAAVVAKADTLTILHITDTHVCNLTGYHPVFVQRRQQYGDGAEALKQFFSTIPLAMRADLVVSTGDNIDFFSSTTARGNLLDTQIEQYAQLLAFCPVRLFCTLGNHDIQQYQMTSDSTYLAQKHNAQQARAVWIRNVACFRQGTYYSQSYQVGDVSYRLIFLDNGYRTQQPPIPFVIDPFQLDWLHFQLQEANNDVEILFMHIPLPIEDANEDGNSFSARPIKLDASSVASNQFLTLLNEFSSIRLIVTGHGHKNIIEDAIFPAGHTIRQIETAAFGQNPQNWRLIWLTGKKILISATGIKTVEYLIPLP